MNLVIYLLLLHHWVCLWYHSSARVYTVLQVCYIQSLMSVYHGTFLYRCSTVCQTLQHWWTHM